jgi:hypothetical protein
MWSAMPLSAAATPTPWVATKMVNGTTAARSHTAQKASTIPWIWRARAMPELVESKMMWSVQTAAIRAETVVTMAPEEKTSAEYGHEYYKTYSRVKLYH